MVTGTSMGGYHAVNVFMRRPDLFDQVLSLSGCFKAIISSMIITMI